MKEIKSLNHYYMLREKYKNKNGKNKFIKIYGRYDAVALNTMIYLAKTETKKLLIISDDITPSINWSTGASFNWSNGLLHYKAMGEGLKKYDVYRQTAFFSRYKRISSLKASIYEVYL